MKDYFAPPPPKPFDYAAFIADINRLIEQGSNMGAMRRAHTSSSFRAWRHEVEDASERIRRLRYLMKMSRAGLISQSTGDRRTDIRRPLPVWACVLQVSG